MTLHYKIAGIWTQVVRPYVKRNGVWTPATQVWRKESGTWVQYFNWDITPPSPPSLTLDLVSTANGRVILVGVSVPGANDPNIKMVRVLQSTTGYPATQYGGNYYSTPDTDYPTEPWSDFYYGSGKEHSATNIAAYKQFPVNATPSTNVAPGIYYFQAWTQDLAGNWSAGTYLQINVPKTGLGTNKVVRDARFQAVNTGTYMENISFTSGDMKQAVSPHAQRGLMFYGHQFVATIGSYYPQGTTTITSAQIYVSRQNDDGSPVANVYLFRHGYGAISELPASNAPPTINEITKIGTIAKGESKWMSIPVSFYGDIVDGSALGFGFYYKDPLKATADASDFSVLNGLTESWRTPGEVYVVWTEEV